MHVRLRAIAIGYAVAILIFAALGAWAVFAPRSGGEMEREIALRFHLGREGTLPAFLQATALLSCGVLLAVIARLRRGAGDPHARRWLVVAAAFCYVALDEAGQLHELAAVALSGMPGLAGAFSWVYLFVPLVVVLGLYLVPWFLSLPRETLRRFALAATLYLGGAVLLEIAAGMWAEGQEAWWSSRFYRALAWTEEVLEMAGVAVFFLALLTYLRDTIRLRSLAIRWEGQRDEPAHGAHGATLSPAVR